MSAFFALVVFLSTPSARRATRVRGLLQFYGAFLSTPSARRATADVDKVVAQPGISIHALREEGDVEYKSVCPSAASISIHALREEGDIGQGSVCSGQDISIHALREEGDIFAPLLRCPQ